MTQSNNLVTKYEELQDREKLEQHLQLSIDALQHLIQIGIATYEDRHNLGHRWLSLGLQLSEVDRFNDADNAFRLAKYRFTEMVDQFGRKPHDLAMCAETLNSWSELMETRGDLIQARLLLEEAIENASAAFSLEPSNNLKILNDYKARLEQVIGNNDVRYLPL